MPCALLCIDSTTGHSTERRKLFFTFGIGGGTMLNAMIDSATQAVARIFWIKSQNPKAPAARREAAINSEQIMG
jgi:hypothetical protein